LEELELFHVRPGDDKLNDLFGNQTPLIPLTIQQSMNLESLVAYVLLSHPQLRVSSQVADDESDAILSVTGKTTVRTVGIRTLGRDGKARRAHLTIGKGITSTKITMEASCDIWAFVAAPRVFLLPKTDNMLLPFLGKRQEFRCQEDQLDAYEVKHGDISILDNLFP